MLITAVEINAGEITTKTIEASQLEHQRLAHAKRLLHDLLKGAAEVQVTGDAEQKVMLGLGMPPLALSADETDSEDVRANQLVCNNLPIDEFNSRFYLKYAGTSLPVYVIRTHATGPNLGLEGVIAGSYARALFAGRLTRTESRDALRERFRATAAACWQNRPAIVFHPLDDAWNSFIVHFGAAILLTENEKSPAQIP